MKKILTFLLVGAVALMAFQSCNDKDEEEVIVTPNGDAYYAELASISSDDALFTATEKGGAVSFLTEGGSVVINVDCEIDWVAENTAEELFTVTTSATSLTITAEANTVEEQLSGTVTLLTANENVLFATIEITQSAYSEEPGNEPGGETSEPAISVDTEEWNAPAKGALTTEITVTANAEWTAESSETWLTAEVTETSLKLTAEENTKTTERTATVTLTCTDGETTATATVTVNQDAAAYVTLSAESLEFEYTTSSETVTVTSNYEVSSSASDSWLTVTASGDTFTVSATANESEESREGTVTFTAGDGAENVASAELKVSQEGMPTSSSGDDDEAMIFIYSITAENTETKLPLYGTVDCTVDWGDETIDTITSTQPSHTYADVKDYEIKITGTVTALNCSANSISTSSKPLPLTAVKQWGKTGLTTMESAFYQCRNLTSLPDAGDAFENVTSFYNAFYYCNSLETIPSGLFGSCPKATTFEQAFYYCTALTAVPEGLFDGCTSATEFKNLFYGDTKIAKIPSKLFENTAAEDLYGVFYNCSSITEIPSDLFEGCSSATTFSWAFYNCTGLTSLPEGGLFKDCSSATNFTYLFDGCSNLASIPGDLFKGCTAATDFTYVFYGYKGTSIPDDLFADCSAATTFYAAFYQASAVTEIPDKLFAACTEMTNIRQAFYQCTGLTALPQSLFSNNKKIEELRQAFYGCSNLTGESPYDLLEDGETKVHLYERENYPEIYVAPKTPNQCFNNCRKLDDFSAMDTNWTTKTTYY